MSDTRRENPLAERVYALLFDGDDPAGGELEEQVATAVPRNATRQISAMTLQKAGDLVVDAKTVLSWLLAALGAPASFTGLLVPIRESGSMLPQAALAPLVRRLAVRKWMWVAGALLQATAVLALAVIWRVALRGTAVATCSSRSPPAGSSPSNSSA